MDGNPKWCCTYLLDPTDPLFIKIGEAFIRLQIAGMPNYCETLEQMILYLFMKHIF